MLPVAVRGGSAAQMAAALQAGLAAAPEAVAAAPAPQRSRQGPGAARSRA